MTEKDLRESLAENIAYYRRQAGMTQTELSEKINYSDKSVSKWERAEGVPDVYVLVQLAEIFGVTVNDLLAKQHRRAKRTPAEQKTLLALLSVVLVFFCATVAFFFCRLFVDSFVRAWLLYIFALPVSAVVLVTFSVMWWRYRTQAVWVSALVWGIALSLHLSLGVEKLYLLYVIGGVFQVLVILW
ncbi:MAG: helix-turn-helix transcriptional regulator, partial [Clostridia bacterium]|nr:helix-turn-helix transcriptional regulator [Clostridia bacterium]